MLGHQCIARGVHVFYYWASAIKTGRMWDKHKAGISTCTSTPTYTTLFIGQAIELDELCSSRYKTISHVHSL